MGNLHLIISLVLVTTGQCYLESLAANVVLQGSYEPMVAFMCNKSAMHMTKNGWVADLSTDCLKTEKEIIKYCEKIYPEAKTSMVILADKEYKISKWCKTGKKHCKNHNKHRVRPYKCVAGAWKSRALLVPEHCVFHHLHNKKDAQCDKETLWVSKSHAWCTNQGFNVKSRAMLRPCKGATYTGIEFVCCPSDKKHKVVAKKGPRVGKKKPASRKPDVYDLYMHKNGKAQYLREHELYLEAKRMLQKHQHDKTATLMEHWSKARRRVEDLKKTDPKKSKQLNDRITKDYEKMYLSMEKMDRVEKQQVNAVHQQHVGANYNALKRKTLDKYIYHLKQRKPKASRLLKTLERYIRVEQKDRRHTVNYYRHLMDVDEDEGNRKRDHIKKHLENCAARIHEAINMLGRVPEYSKQLKEKARNFVQTFRDLDMEIIQLLFHPKPQIVNVQSQKPEVKTEVEPEVEPKVEPEVKPEVTEDEVVEEYREEYSKKHKPKMITTVGRDKDLKKDGGYNKLGKANGWKKASKMDPETYEDEHKYMKEIAASHVKTNRQSVHENSIDMEVKKVQVHGNSVVSTVVGIVVGCLAVIGVIIIAIIVVKKNHSRTPANHGFIEVDQCTPEEKHVANMQVNGYENPTYRYFEEVVA